MTKAMHTFSDIVKKARLENFLADYRTAHKIEKINWKYDYPEVCKYALETNREDLVEYIQALKKEDVLKK